MLAKLIVHAPTRERAIERMHRALLELTIDGVDTSRDFHLRMMENEDFRKGDIGIQWLEKHLDDLLHVRPDRADVLRAAIAAALMAERDRSAHRGAPAPSSRGEAALDGSTWLRVARREALR